MMRTILLVSVLCISILLAGSAGLCGKPWIYLPNLGCYYFAYNETKDFVGAYQFCQNLDAYLAEIKNKNQHIALQTIANALLSNVTFWIGGNDIAEDGLFMWVHDMKPVTTFFWGEGQPENGTDEDCIVLNGMQDHTWHDTFCHLDFSPLCEKNLVTKDVKDILGELEKLPKENQIEVPK